MRRGKKAAAVVVVAIIWVPVGDDEIDIAGALGQYLRGPVLIVVNVPTVITQGRADHGADLDGRIDSFHCERELLDLLPVGGRRKRGIAGTRVGGVGIGHRIIDRVPVATAVVTRAESFVANFPILDADWRGMVDGEEVERGVIDPGRG